MIYAFGQVKRTAVGGSEGRADEFGVSVRVGGINPRQGGLGWWEYCAGFNPQTFGCAEPTPEQDVLCFQYLSISQSVLTNIFSGILYHRYYRHGRVLVRFWNGAEV